MTEERTPTDGKPLHREIRSFVLRQGRTTEAQREALERDWPRFGLDWPRPMAHPASWFSTEQPVVVEIGFGNGEALGAAAAADPGRNYLGIEVHRPGVGRLLRQLAAENLDNVRVISADAVEVLREGIAPGSLDEVRLYFPDPWHKKRHHKRRIVQTPFCDLVASRLAPGGASTWRPTGSPMRCGCVKCSTCIRSSAIPAVKPAMCPSPKAVSKPISSAVAASSGMGSGIWSMSGFS